jgi:muconolactone delta-isomerase
MSESLAYQGAGAPARDQAHTPFAQTMGARRANELAGQEHLLRLRKLPRESHALGLWRARDPAEMQAFLESPPLDAWMTVQTTPLTPHPSDPGLAAS